MLRSCCDHAAIMLRPCYTLHWRTTSLVMAAGTPTLQKWRAYQRTTFTRQQWTGSPRTAVSGGAGMILRCSAIRWYARRGGSWEETQPTARTAPTQPSAHHLCRRFRRPLVRPLFRYHLYCHHSLLRLLRPRPVHPRHRSCRGRRGSKPGLRFLQQSPRQTPPPLCSWSCRRAPPWP